MKVVVVLLLAVGFLDQEDKVGAEEEYDDADVDAAEQLESMLLHHLHEEYPRLGVSVDVEEAYDLKEVQRRHGVRAELGLDQRRFGAFAIATATQCCRCRRVRDAFGQLARGERRVGEREERETGGDEEELDDEQRTCHVTQSTGHALFCFDTTKNVKNQLKKG